MNMGQDADFAKLKAAIFKCNLRLWPLASQGRHAGQRSASRLISDGMGFVKVSEA
jgi:hypothetical protein